MKHQRKKIPNTKDTNTDTKFDVSMGSCDGTEYYQFIRIYIQYFLINILWKDNMSL